MFKKIIFAIILSFLVLIGIRNFVGVTNAATEGTKYFVSNREINPPPSVRDGLSWNTAWKELSDIKWKDADGSGVQAGDKIFIDGGTNVPYKTPLTVKGKGIDATQQIIIKIPEPSIPESENGTRSGNIIITGISNITLQAPPPLTDSCISVIASGDANFTRKDVASHGIDFGDKSFVTVDGGKWGGIKITKFSGSGIQITRGRDITIRNVEVTDNGSASAQYGNIGDSQPECKRIGLPDHNIWETDSPGITTAGTNITIENANIHDNGQDQISTGQSDFQNLTVNRSWLHNQRSHAIVSSDPFNFETHSDGIQSPASEGNHHLIGLHINQSIIGPGLMHGLILGEPNDISTNPTHSFDVSDVTLKDVLMLSHYGQFMNANILAKSPIDSEHPQNDFPKNWVVEKVTSVIGAQFPNHNFFNEEHHGSDHIATNSIFVGGGSNDMVGFDSRSVSNCSALDVDNIPSYRTKNIFFAKYDKLSAGLDKISPNVDNPELNQFDLALTSNTDTNCLNSGTSITSLRALLALVDPAPIQLPISWHTKDASIDAKNFFLLLNGKQYFVNPTDLNVTSTQSGNLTMSAKWVENKNKIQIVNKFKCSKFIKKVCISWVTTSMFITFNGFRHDYKGVNVIKGNMSDAFVAKQLDLITTDKKSSIHFDDLSVQLFSTFPAPTKAPTPTLTPTPTL